jgi:hypothetical protein
VIPALGLGLLVTSSGQARAQEPLDAGSVAPAEVASSAPVVIESTSASFNIDGVVDEPGWDLLEPFPLTMYSPTFGAELTERTEIRITHDDEYLYMSARMYDSDPSLIRANTFYRDRYSGDDLISIMLDSYNDYETGVWFVTNPTGARQDRTISNDGQFSGGGMPMNWDWNSHWDVATTVTDEGWFAEFRIPFSTLGFQAPEDEVTMGLALYRVIARKNERQTYPAMDPEWGGLAFARPSRAQRITLRNVRQSTPIYVTPYGLGGMAQNPELGVREDGTPRWEMAEDPTTEVGADLKYSPTSNLALDMTVNTDFAQVEADQQQINLTRFPLFFPEKRQFFQERSSTFDFNTGGFNNRLFHSRQIGLADGQIVRIYGGVRAVGRLGGTDYGFLNMQTAAHAGRSAENMGVLRVRQQILNPYSNVGGMVTTRFGSDGQNNLAYGLDTQLRVVGDEYILAKWAQTFDEQVDAPNALDGGLVQARWERRREGGLSYYADFIRVGSDYIPRLGFQLRRVRRDFTFGGAQVQYKSFRNAESPFLSLGAALNTGNYFRNEDGSAESRSITPQLLAEFKNGAQVNLSLISAFESIPEPFAIAEAVIPPGEYWFSQVQAKIELARQSLFRGDYAVSYGQFYDGTRLGLIINPTWNPSRYLELGAGYEFNNLDFPDRSQSTRVHLGRLNVQMAFNTQISMSAFMQYNSTADLGTMNLRFRYHFREGTDLWIVYNEGLNTVRAAGLDPRLPLSAGRSLMIKYTYAFIW